MIVLIGGVVIRKKEWGPPRVLDKSRARADVSVSATETESEQRYPCHVPSQSS